MESFRAEKDNVEYLASLTSLRGIAAVLVMLFHIDVLTYYRGLGTLVAHTETQIITKGYLWVDFFFVLSGFVMMHSSGNSFSGGVSLLNIRSYLANRFWRIYPLHLACLLVLVLFVIAFPVIFPAVLSDGSWATYFDWSALLHSLTLLNAHGLHTYLSWNMVSWSIGAEWWAYVLAIPLYPYLRRASVGASLAIIILGYLLLVLLAMSVGGNSLDITHDFGVVRCLIGFMVGIGLRSVFCRFREHWLLTSDLLLLANVFLLVALLHLGSNDYIVAISMGCLVFLGAAGKGSVSAVLQLRPLQYLGEISYSIYLMHGVVFMFAWYVLPIIVGADTTHELGVYQHLIIWGVFIATTLPLAFLSHRYVEVPFRKGLRTE